MCCYANGKQTDCDSVDRVRPPATPRIAYVPLKRIEEHPALEAGRFTGASPVVGTTFLCSSMDRTLSYELRNRGSSPFRETNIKFFLYKFVQLKNMYYICRVIREVAPK